MCKENRTILKLLCAATLLCAEAIGTAGAQTYNVLASFNGTDGGNANAAMIQGLDGNFYGMTPFGGNYNSFCQNGCGTVFKLTPTGTLTTLYKFCSETNCVDGVTPEERIVQAANGNFYGTASAGGANNDPYYCFNAGCGTLFELSPAGKFRVLYNFCSQAHCTDGTAPVGLMQAANGSLYGIAGGGGYSNVRSGPCRTGCGTIFEVTAAGKFKTLYQFCSEGNCNNGSGASIAPIQASNGNLYGTTTWGGVLAYCPDVNFGCGTVYELTLAGKFTSLYSFCSQMNCADGETPMGLTQGADGNFYGNTIVGSMHAGGNVYQITPSGQRTTLYDFCTDKSGTNCVDGSSPQGVVQAADGNFYGTTTIGGNSQGSVLCEGSGCGTIFKLTKAGQLTTLYSFCPEADCLDGALPVALMQATNGTFYGIGSKGGADFNGCISGGGCGDAYNISVGFGPFVQPNPIGGVVGGMVNILGNNLTGTTTVEFNGTRAKFTVVSDTYIKTAVPSGATSGPIKVTTPNGTIKSNIRFRVIP